MNYLLVCGWGICICCAFWGYGNALLRLLSIRTAPWPLTATTGISLLLAFGGVLNLTGYIVAPVLVSLVIIGDVLALWGDGAGWDRCVSGDKDATQS